jgi:hypothetical protein
MSTHSHYGLTQRLRTFAMAAVLGTLTLIGLHAHSTLAQEPEEPCLDQITLNRFTTSRTTIEAGSGQSATLSWEVFGGQGTGCLSRVKLYLEVGGLRSLVNKTGTKSVSPASTTSYRLYLLDPGYSGPGPRDTYLGNPIAITVLQPPPTPPADCN